MNAHKNFSLVPLCGGESPYHWKRQIEVLSKLNYWHQKLINSKFEQSFWAFFIHLENVFTFCKKKWTLCKHSSEAALYRCSYKKVFWKYAAYLQGEYPCRSVISIKLQSNFIQITIRHGRSLVNMLQFLDHRFLRREGCFWQLKGLSND